MSYALSLLVLLTAQSPEGIVLAENGATDWVIVVTEDAIAPEHTAALELQEHLEAVTGAAFPIQNTADEGAKAIVIGPTPQFAAAFPDIDLAALGHDGIVLKTAGNRIDRKSVV